jgi:hypothetical protein
MQDRLSAKPEVYAHGIKSFFAAAAAISQEFCAYFLRFCILTI